MKIKWVQMNIAIALGQNMDRNVFHPHPWRYARGYSLSPFLQHASQTSKVGSIKHLPHIHYILCFEEAYCIST